jgi:hypothetical protein
MTSPAEILRPHVEINVSRLATIRLRIESRDGLSFDYHKTYIPALQEAGKRYQSIVDLLIGKSETCVGGQDANCVIGRQVNIQLFRDNGMI